MALFLRQSQFVTIDAPPVATPSITVSLTPSARSVVQGASTTYTVTVARLGGFTGAVALSVSGLPAGATGTLGATSLASGVTTTTLTVVVGESATPVSNDSFSVLATGSGVAPHTANGTLTITSGASPGFSLEVWPAALYATPGNSTSAIVTLTRTGGYTTPVPLSAAGLPAGATASFTPSTLSGDTMTAMMTVSVAEGSALVSADPASVVGMGSGGVADASATITVTIATLQHYGPAELPRVTPSAVSTNTLGAGTTHTPADRTALLALLGSGTLAGGHNIVLTDGVNYGAITWPKGVTGATYTNPVTVVTSNLARLPAAGERVGPAHALATPHLRSGSNNEAFLQVEAGANGWRFLGIEGDVGSTTEMYSAVQLGPALYGQWSHSEFYSRGTLINNNNYDTTDGGLGDGKWYVCDIPASNKRPNLNPTYWHEFTIDDLPDGLTLDRCGFRMGYTNSASSSTIWLAECRTLSMFGCWAYSEAQCIEAHAFSAVHAAGPWLIENNAFAAPTICSLTGGSPPYFDVVPTDVTFRRNLYWKDKRWNGSITNPDYDGRTYHVKNTFEFKVILRALVEDNLFWYGWNGDFSQYYAIVFKISTGADYGGGPGFANAITKDITFRYNQLKDLSGGIAVGTRDLYGGGTVGAVSDVSAYHNYTPTPLGLHSHDGSVESAIFIGDDSMGSVLFEHNTFVGDFNRAYGQTAAMFCNGDLPPANLTVRNHISSFGAQYGGWNVNGFVYHGKTALNLANDHGPIYLLDTANNKANLGGDYSTPFVVTQNPDDLFVDYAGYDFHVVPALVGTGYNGETPGADIDLVDARCIGALAGVWS